MLIKFWLQNLNVRNQLGDAAVAVRIILKWTLQKEDMGWIHLAQVKFQWHAVVLD
jgi:hypothetical protein